ncbi:MAG: MBL fold metallo-hydrolase [Candidatus Latescibacterota bacterium]
MESILKTDVTHGSLGIWWIGQGGFVFKTSEGRIVMVDPYLSFSMQGVTYLHPELALRPESVRADFVLCTHDHMDHTDEPTLSAIARSDTTTKFLGPPSSAKRMMTSGIPEKRITSIVRGQVLRLDEAISAEAVYAHHSPDSCGFIFDFGGILVYLTGDTEVGLHGYLDRMDRVKGLEPDLMIVCINPGYNNLGPVEAAELTEWVDPEVVIPMHYDLIAENTVDPQEFVDALSTRRGKAAPVLMAYGGRHLFAKK